MIPATGLGGNLKIGLHGFNYVKILTINVVARYAHVLQAKNSPHTIFATYSNCMDNGHFGRYTEI